MSIKEYVDTQALQFTSLIVVEHRFLLFYIIFFVNQDCLDYFGDNLQHQSSAVLRECPYPQMVFLSSWFSNLPWSYQSYRQLSGVSELWCLPFILSPHWSSPTESGDDFRLILKRINMQLDSEVQRRFLSLSSPAHLGILPLIPSNTLLPN